jgi:hypothetical protein
VQVTGAACHAMQVQNGAQPSGAVQGALQTAKNVVADNTAILKKPTPDVRTLYDFDKVLGKGQFGTTRWVGGARMRGWHAPSCTQPANALTMQTLQGLPSTPYALSW